MKFIETIFYTDYPFTEFGDVPYKKAPVRPINILEYDGDKYCRILVNGLVTEIKSGYIYTKPGRLGKVPNISRYDLEQFILKD